MTTDRLLREQPAYHAWWFLARAYHSIAGELGRFFEDHGITGAQFGVMRCVADAGPEGLMLSDLSKRLMVTCGNITGVVDRLEQAGYLRRQRAWGDRRVVLAQLTPEGEGFFRNLMPLYQDVVSELMSGLGPAEKEVLGACCEKLHLAVETARSAEPLAHAGIHPE